MSDGCGNIVLAPGKEAFHIKINAIGGSAGLICTESEINVELLSRMADISIIMKDGQIVIRDLNAGWKEGTGGKVIYPVEGSMGMIR